MLRVNGVTIRSPQHRHSLTTGKLAGECDTSFTATSCLPYDHHVCLKNEPNRQCSSSNSPPRTPRRSRQRARGSLTAAPQRPRSPTTRSLAISRVHPVRSAMSAIFESNIGQAYDLESVDRFDIGDCRKQRRLKRNRLTIEIKVLCPLKAADQGVIATRLEQSVNGFVALKVRSLNHDKKDAGQLRQLQGANDRWAFNLPRGRPERTGWTCARLACDLNGGGVRGRH